MKIHNDVFELVGGTPLVRLSNYAEKLGLGAEIVAKLEYFNPAGSSKDRAGFELLGAACERGEINPDSTIIEPTSGNAGVALACAAARRGLKAIIVMPENMSEERKKLIAAYGAKVVLTEASGGMKGAVEKAEELTREIPGAYLPSQFDDPANPESHYRTTGPEIWRDCDGKLDFIIAGIGTGGTISGTGKYLKEKNPGIKAIGVEPADSPFLTRGRAGAHEISGLGAGFIPKTFDQNVCDEILTASTREAYSAARLLARVEGILAGVSSGAALSAANAVASRPENRGKRIVVILPDGGERYLSTGLFG